MTHKKRRHAVSQQAKPAQAEMALAPIQEVVAAAAIPATPAGDGNDRYLWLSGLALALLAVAALSLYLLSARLLEARVD